MREPGERGCRIWRNYRMQVVIVNTLRPKRKFKKALAFRTVWYTFRCNVFYVGRSFSRTPPRMEKARNTNWRYYKERAIARKQERQETRFSQTSAKPTWKCYNPVESNVPLSPQQLYVLELIRQGKNVFYTGSAGTGKTTLLKEIVKCSPECETFVTALTGVAAVQAGGMTLHSFAGIGLGNGTADSLLQIVQRGHKKRNWWSCQVLIIDEVSMLAADLFDKLEYIARKIRRKELPFGGIQLILCGDFFQLPPIAKLDQAAAKYCFQSQTWRGCIEHSIELTQIYRQSDPKLIRLLNEVRYDQLTGFSIQLLNSMKRSLPQRAVEPTKLHSHNADVNAINNRFLAQLPGDEVIYTAVDKGRDPYKQNMNKYCTAMDILVLKENAQVMLLKNIGEELINGSRGVVVGFEDGWPQVLFANGTEQIIKQEKWDLEDRHGKVLACRKQIPLKLAWAITIHKSQGMSIDLLQVDLNQVFSQGQAYVALSRARTLEGLQVLSFDKEKFWTSPEVIKFYKSQIIPAKEISTLPSPEVKNQVSEKEKNVYMVQGTKCTAAPSVVSRKDFDIVTIEDDFDTSFVDPWPAESCGSVNGAAAKVNLNVPPPTNTKRPSPISNSDVPPSKKPLFKKKSPTQGSHGPQASYSIKKFLTGFVPSSRLLGTSCNARDDSEEFQLTCGNDKYNTVRTVDKVDVIHESSLSSSISHSKDENTTLVSTNELASNSSQNPKDERSNHLQNECLGSVKVVESQRREVELTHSQEKETVQFSETWAVSPRHRTDGGLISHVGVSVSTQTDCTCHCRCGVAHGSSFNS